MTQWTKQSANDASTPRVWLVRGGRQGQDESLALESGHAIIGFNDNLTGNRVDVSRLVEQADPGSRSRRTSQLIAFVWGMSARDIVAMPLKTRPGLIALGRVAGPYRYQEIDGAMRHTVRLNGPARTYPGLILNRTCSTRWARSLRVAFNATAPRAV